MNKSFTKQQLIDRGGIVDSMLQIRIVTDMGTYLYTQYFVSCGPDCFQYLYSR